MIVKAVGFAAVVVALQSCAALHGFDHGQPRTDNCSQATCKVDVDAKIVAGRCVVTAPGPDDQLIVTGSNRVIVWKLPNDFEFCPANADGIRFKSDTNGQFDENWATEHENGNAPSDRSCKRHYRWRDRNDDQPGAKGPFDYELRFRPKGSWSTNGILCRLDPWVVNR